MDYRSKKRNFNDQTEWKVYKDYEKVPPIVSEELWEKANQKLLARSKNAAMYQKHQTLYALSGKLYCDKHKCGFVRKIRHYKNKDNVIYWYCADFHKSGKKNCIPACFKEQDLYDILLSIFKSYEIYKEEICEELLSFYKELSKEEENIEQEKKLQNELEVLTRKKDKLLDLALDGLLSKEDLNNKNISIEMEISEIQAKLKELEAKKKKPEEEKEQNKKLKESILKQSVITKNNLENYIEELLDKIIVIEKKAKTINDIQVKENSTQKQNNKKQEQKNQLDKKETKQDNEIELKIILTGNKIITYGSATKPRQFSQLRGNKVADLKNLPFCHSYAHG